MTSETPSRARKKGPGRPPGASTQQGRQALLDAARALLAEQGQSGFTLRAVAERAGVRPTLANYYFGGKEGLLRAVIEQIAERVGDRLAEALRTDGPPEERLRRFIHLTLETLAEDRYAPRLFMEQVLLPDSEITDSVASNFIAPNVSNLSSLLSEGQSTGAFERLDPRFLVPALMGMINFFLLAAPLFRRVFDEDPFDPDFRNRYADFVADLFLRGIRREPPKKDSEHG